jgi:hypothetical protein
MDKTNHNSFSTPMSIRPLPPPVPEDTSVYTSPINSTSIRLLQFSRNEDGTFTGKLNQFKLADAPPFYTASYVWGERSYSSSNSLRLESGSLPVLASLAPFLDMVSQHKDFSKKDWWWIDSLCINLKDGTEREGQVKIMGKIYRRARRVIIWLGEEKEENSDCTGATHFLFQLASLPAAFRTQKPLRQELIEDKFSEQWASVGRLLARKWWTRVWTLQEFVLPAEAKFYCGTHSISRGKFKSAMYNIHLCSTGSGDYVNDLIPRQAFDAAFNRRRIHQWYIRSSGMNLVAIMAYLGTHSATDARDILYSVLGLITARDRRLVGDAEYQSAVWHIYAKLVRSFWEEHKSLDIICFTHLFNRHSGNLDAQGGGGNEVVPSWTPDWRARIEFISPVPLMVSQSASECIGNFRPLGSAIWKAMYDAPGNLRERSNVRFHENLREMWCDGVVLDTITGLGGLEGCETRCRSYVCRDSGHDITQSQLGGNGEEGTVSSMEIIAKVARSLTLDRRDKYLRFYAPDHYVENFIALCHACLALENQNSTSNSNPERTALDPLFRTWFTQNEHLVFSGRTLAQHIIILIMSNPRLFATVPLPTLQPSYSFPPISPTPSSLDHHRDQTEAEEQEQDSYLTRFHDTVRKKSRKLMVTGKGYVGMAPCRARLGDVVAIVFGCSIPLVLRRSGVREAWTVVGEAYVDGVMQGEVEGLLGDEVFVKTLRLV